MAAIVLAANAGHVCKASLNIAFEPVAFPRGALFMAFLMFLVIVSGRVNVCVLTWLLESGLGESIPMIFLERARGKFLNEF